MKQFGWIAAVLLLITACAEQPAPPGVKIGKPYVIDGKTYYPSYDPTYDKTGVASWYGPGFHGKRTANGEKYDKYDLTAAHPTLPMPSLVRVTNLENGKSLVVRINDRGPFAENRIIDLSKRSAQLLGISGLGKVRVQFLKEETERYVAERKDRGSEIDMFAYNEQVKTNRDVAITQSTAPEETEIVEQRVSTSGSSGQVVDAAPIMSVGTGELSSKPSIGKPGKEVVLHKPGAVTPAQSNDEPEPGAVLLSSASPLPIKPENVKPVSPTHKVSPSSGVSSSGYFIQAGSFSSEGNAEKLKGKLMHLPDVRIEKIDMVDKIWWRVRVGPFEEKSAADITLAEVRSSGAPDARIVQE